MEHDLHTDDMPDDLPDIDAVTPDGEPNLREDAYWQEDLRFLGVPMAIWFACSFGAGILCREWLDQFSLGGHPLGFRFAHPSRSAGLGLRTQSCRQYRAVSCRLGAGAALAA